MYIAWHAYLLALHLGPHPKPINVTAWIPINFSGFWNRLIMVSIKTEHFLWCSHRLIHFCSPAALHSHFGRFKWQRLSLPLVSYTHSDNPRILFWSCLKWLARKAFLWRMLFSQLPFKISCARSWEPHAWKTSPRFLFLSLYLRDFKPFSGIAKDLYDGSLQSWYWDFANFSLCTNIDAYIWML